MGFPSAGKSSFLRKVSAAKPEVAAYHLTTLSPILGVVSLDDERNFVVADIPGLIEGASLGVGLGDEFLRHVERTKVLIHILDAAGSEGRDPFDDFNIINNALSLYSPKLLQKKQIVAANKIDLIQDPKVLDDLRSKIEAKGYEFFPISTLTGEGIRPLLESVWDLLQEISDVQNEESEKVIVYEEPKEEFTVEVKDGVFYITGKRIEKLVSMTNFEDYVSLRRFDRAWKFMGIDKLLKKNGIQEGDTVNLYGTEFTFSDNRNQEETEE